MKTFDCIIIGGGILGCAVTYELGKRGKKTLLIEKDYPGAGSTGRCIGGIRQQFSTPGSIKIMMRSVEIFKQMQDISTGDGYVSGIDWHQGGYLFLACSEKEKTQYLSIIKTQQECGLPVKYIEKEEALKIVPMLNEFDFIGGAYCNKDGQANPFQVLKFYLDGIEKTGGVVLSNTKVVKININNNIVDSVITNTGDKFSAPTIINTAGPWAKEIAQLVGVELPIEAERHEALITEPTKKLFAPMIVCYSPSCYFQQFNHTGQIIGCYTPEDPAKGFERSSSSEFLPEFSNRILKLIPALKDLKVVRSWAGWYEITPDGSPIVGETGIKGFWVVAGGCGHGFMFGPAIGKGTAEIICEGKSEISLEEFSINRKFKSKETMK
ncbi:MAG: FAD-dependent oxidoreductase [bacterium]